MPTSIETTPTLPTVDDVMTAEELQAQSYQVMDLRIRQQVRLIQEDFFRLGVYLREAYDAHLWEHLPGVASWADYLATVGIPKSKASYLMALPTLVRPALMAAGLSAEEAQAEIIAVDETKYGILVPQMRGASVQDILDMVRHAQQASWQDLRETYGPQPTVAEDEPWELRVRRVEEDTFEIHATVTADLLDRLVRRFHPVVQRE